MKVNRDRKRRLTKQELADKAKRAQKESERIAGHLKGSFDEPNDPRID